MKKLRILFFSGLILMVSCSDDGDGDKKESAEPSKNRRPHVNAKTGQMR